nr:D-alanyl-D-alanine carboxypeptidase [uncultured Holophaga sp.]
MHRLKGLAAALLLTLPLAATDFQTWSGALQARGISVSAGLWDLSTGKLVEGCQTDLPLVPASTAKVVTTYAMLKSWKPDTELLTEISGDLKDGVVQGDLVIKGSGDPFLVPERIWLLAQELRRQGVQRIVGRVRPDQSAFDAQMYGPGWENTAFRNTPPILPLSVGFNRDESGAYARDPSALAAGLVTRILRESGIPVEEREMPAGPLRRIHTLSSPPLRRLVQDINKYSNNFMVEMLLKAFGGGTWSGGTARVQAFYQSVLALGPESISLVDGSGLSKDDRLSARTLAIVLRAAWNDFEVGPEFVDSLKIIGGEPWHLKHLSPETLRRLTRRVRCKTGHLNDVVTVCGYLQKPDGGLRVFAILLNGKAEDDDIWEMVSHWAE